MRTVRIYGEVQPMVKPLCEGEPYPYATLWGDPVKFVDLVEDIGNQQVRDVDECIAT